MTVIIIIGSSAMLFANGSKEASSVEKMEPVTVTVWNWSQELTDFFNTQSENFNADNKGIKVEFKTIAQDQYSQTLPLAFSAGNSPDIFWLTPEQDPHNFVDQSWVQPLDSYIDKDFLSQFNPALFAEGSMYFNGKLYTIPFENRLVKLNGLMFYNKNVFKEAGLDPKKDLPKTFSEFRSILKKITNAGKGKYYGIVWSGNPAKEVSRILNGLLPVSAPSSADIRYGRIAYNYGTGKFSLDSKGHQRVFSLMNSIVSDGSIVPGWVSMKKATARQLFGQNKAAFYFDGTWMPGIWKKDFPNFEYGKDFGVDVAPVPDSGREAFRAMGLAHGDIFVSSQTKHIDETIKVYKWLYSKEFSTAYFKASGSFPANLKVDYSSATPFQKRVVELAKNYVRVSPEPFVKNPAAGKVVWPKSSPLPEEIYAAALIKGGLASFVSAAENWDKMQETVLQRNLKKAQDEGANVSREDFIFPNWNPMKDYTY